jgi:hypothetical protein
MTGGSADRTVRIASGQGFWGDWLEAPIRQVEGGPIDYLMMDYLAEVTMSIMQKQRSRDPSMGYAKDFVPLMERLLPSVVERGIRIVSNAGGVNPLSCARHVYEVAEALGLDDRLTIGVVMGDDILDRLPDLMARGHELRNIDTGEPLDAVLERIQSANVYLGAWPIVEALRRGADVIITGRVTDTGLTLAPMIHEFGWAEDDWSLLAAGTVAGHINECGAQATGGNCLVDWETIPDLADPGYPVIEAAADGSFVVTKHPGTGGRVSVASVTEQLLYEMGDPANYITPDCVVDFTSMTLAPAGSDRVRVAGVRGRPATDSLKVSISYLYGYKSVGTLVYAWPDAYRKARKADEVIRERLRRLGLRFEEIHTEFVGVNATHGPLAGAPDPDIAEVQLRIGVRAREAGPVQRFSREIAPLILNGPPSATGFAGGRPKVEEIVAYWPALLPKDEIQPTVATVEGEE